MITTAIKTHEYTVQVSRTCDFCGLVELTEERPKGEQSKVKRLSYQSYAALWPPEDESEYENYDVCDSCWELKVEVAIKALLSTQPQ